MKLDVKEGENELSCFLKGMEESSYKSSLTLVVKVKAKAGKAKQAGSPLAVVVFKDKIFVDVDPDKGPVHITWN